MALIPDETATGAKGPEVGVMKIVVGLEDEFDDPDKQVELWLVWRDSFHLGGEKFDPNTWDMLTDNFQLARGIFSERKGWFALIANDGLWFWENDDDEGVGTARIALFYPPTSEGDRKHPSGTGKIVRPRNSSLANQKLLWAATNHATGTIKSTADY